MGLFDKIKGNEEEVELKPSQRERDYRFGEEEMEEDREDDDEFLLPGMKSAEDSSDSSSSKKSPKTRKRKDDRMERLIEQNERIIELLEDMAGTESESEGQNMDTVL
ncbi:MAG: hypothetical protein MUP63_02090 [Candidatus Nanohaloarchaeota archaeon QJJ-7]|nr:hypothetical protein [Candidatus Nanohaloarchaeota archaeon QJJ-7]